MLRLYLLLFFCLVLLSCSLNNEPSYSSMSEDSKESIERRLERFKHSDLEKLFKQGWEFGELKNADFLSFCKATVRRGHVQYLAKRLYEERKNKNIFYFIMELEHRVGKYVYREHYVLFKELEKYPDFSDIISPGTPLGTVKGLSRFQEYALKLESISP